MLEEEGPDLVAESSGELATITSEIGALVGGEDGDDAERLYEMGMVYLEMGLFDQAEFIESDVQDDPSENEALREKLDEIDPDSLTPREALALLYELKDL